MKRISDFPFSFTLSGETWELQKSLIRKIRVDGREEKMALDGNVIAAVVDERLDDMAIAIEYEPDSRIFVMTKQHGFVGPYQQVDALEFDATAKVAILTGTKDGVHGKHVVKN